MTWLEFITNLFIEALLFLRNYLFFPGDGVTFSLLRIASLAIAFTISGAIIVFMSQSAVLKHMGPQAKRFKAYGVASISGVILAVCSCSVLPIFASIRKKGAGIGPAIAFLFSGPAINVLALTLTFTDIGADIAIARVIGAVLLAFVIGWIMFFIFRKSEIQDTKNSPFMVLEDDKKGHKLWQIILFFATLFAILIFGVYRPLPTLFLIGLLVLQLVLFFTKEDVKEWLYETSILTKKILPLFIVGVFIAGILNALITPQMLVDFVGNNTYQSNIIASMIGSLMYFATLTEVPIVKTLLENGMHRGPATALLLAGPSLSIPNMIIITKVIGVKRTLTYVALVVVFAAMVGLIAGYVYYI